MILSLLLVFVHANALSLMKNLKSGKITYEFYLHCKNTPHPTNAITQHSA